ncbi:hypothetical protein D3C76_1785060 [compost metagenome]
MDLDHAKGLAHMQQAVKTAGVRHVFPAAPHMDDFPYGMGRLKYLPEQLEVVLCIVRINLVLIPVNPAKTSPHLHRTHSVPFG